ncbi:MAG: GDSL-type esterase/lipase family protein [Humidesulfovibrio sp.]|jgi:acyl-CoA thioesterase-1|uniref:GDSL-type esterase/lipase family protein n=1 Tax=Humidesulfovibrio sp. TaxID=2910988 RepID=UPI0027377601|nr:GDSL-type esterase/lipase family protein [Humidesulfovibrio sp.]MDP2847226.1 GDSL-type esterase/lipase family protein [Humidesulfovibrio sp.]
MQQTPTLSAQQDNRVILAAYGDSLVAGWGLSTQDGLVAQLEAELVKAGAGGAKGVRVLDFGVSGDTSVDGLERLSEVLAAKPRAVLLEFGANDCYQGLPLDETRDALYKMITALRAEGVAVLLAGWRTSMDLFKPYDDPDLAGLVPLAPPLYTADYVERFNRMHAELARRLEIPCMTHILDPLDGQIGCYQADGVHPSAKGAAILAQALAPQLLPLLDEPPLPE